MSATITTPAPAPHTRVEDLVAIVTGGGQDFVRVFAEDLYSIPREKVVGSAGATKYGHDAQGQAVPLHHGLLDLEDLTARARPGFTAPRRG